MGTYDSVVFLARFFKYRTQRMFLMTLMHVILACFLGAVMSGCSYTRMVANQTTAMMIKATPAYDRETDLDFAEQAMAAHLKLLEGLLEVTPDNSDLLLLTSSSFSRYAFGFIEWKIDLADAHNDFEKKDKLTARAVDFYERAKKYGLRSLSQSRKGFLEVFGQDLDTLSGELKHLNRKYLPALFWTAYAWGNTIRLQQDQPARIVELPKVELMMRRVLAMDETYYFGSPHLLLGVFYGSRPKMLGGSPEKARFHVLRAIEIARGRYLLAQFLLCQFYAVPAQDRTLFETTLREILAAPITLFPEQGLANEIAKRKAEHWLKRVDELFF